MSITVNPDLIREIKKYGAFDISACFQCGNCTAVCPLSSENGSFPRKLIRYGQLGARDRIVGSIEPWLCYYCGECSQTCPREAEPGEYMAALRRYSIAACEPTGLGKLMYMSGLVMLTVTLILGAIFAGFMAVVKSGDNPSSWLFGSVSYNTIHWLGIAAGILSMLAFLGGLARMVRGMSKDMPEPKPGIKQVKKALIATLIEVITLRRHRGKPEDTVGPAYLQASVVHKAIFYGFMGLLAATTLDLIFLELLPLHLTIFWPARIIGTISGVSMLYGVIAAILRRTKKLEKNVSKTALSDAWLLGFLLLLAITGFYLEIMVTLRMVSPTNDMVLLVHSAMAMELVMLVAFTKLAHAVYRPLALFFYSLKGGEL